ncbi:uncharacterized protein LOC130998102 [Salvia miltiorrhiza]|uniref:uncharacterized protein LOC130998102 n=1 Tax=Salvia miltiorrhiza TaxID=226208 RepID=UPI0025AD3C7B|nr:uncharacterized protein LOC130998102 [Salvia miltiorrhiza]
MAGGKRRAECENGEAAEETHYSIQHKQSSTNDPSVEIISENEEVESCFNHDFEYVDGHRVKTQFAPLLRAVFNKYGDISRGNNVKSSKLVSIFLERICHVYERVEQADLTRAEIQGMLSELRLFERRKLKVRWIVERLEYKSIEFMEKDLEAYGRQVCSLQRKISSIRAQLLEMHKARNDQTEANRSEAVRRSTRSRKKPDWHKAFCFLYDT